MTDLKETLAKLEAERKSNSEILQSEVKTLEEKESMTFKQGKLYYDNILRQQMSVRAANIYRKSFERDIKKLEKDIEDFDIDKVVAEKDSQLTLEHKSRLLALENYDKYVDEEVEKHRKTLLAKKEEIIQETKDFDKTLVLQAFKIRELNLLKGKKDRLKFDKKRYKLIYGELHDKGFVE